MASYAIRFRFSTKGEGCSHPGFAIVEAQNIIDAHTAFANTYGKQFHEYKINEATKIADHTPRYTLTI